MHISVFALFRDSQNTIYDSLDRLNNLNDIENVDFDFFFYENDSKDNTRQILKDWIQDKPVKLFYEDVNTPRFGSVPDLYRLVLLSYYRNKLKEMAGPVQSDYCLLIDSDILFDNTHVEMLIDEIKKGWVMVTPNTRQYQIKDLMFDKSEDSFYDTFATRDIYFNNVMSFTDCPLILNDDRGRWFADQPVEVASAFGGLALVNSNAYNQSKWSTHGWSEHVNFCSELRRFGQICILPTCKPKSTIDLNTVHMPSVINIAQQNISLMNSVNNVYTVSTCGRVPVQ